MANHLTMVTISTIETLHRSGYSNRRIAELLNIHRGTVSKYVKLIQNRPNAPTGSDAVPTTSPVEQHELRPGPVSACEAFREVITGWVEQGLSAQRIYQDLVTEHHFSGKYPSVRRFVARLRGSSELPVRRLETAPGEEAQVDFGLGAMVHTAQGRRRTWVFRIVLSYSRKAYSEAVYQQSTDAFIGALENSFRHFGGAPKTLVIDNLKAAVQKADWYDPELHPKLQSFARHYSTVFLPTRPYTPQHKGKVESGVKYVKNNALKARRFPNLQAENDLLLHWEQTVADTRIHGTTKQQVRRRFQEHEQAALLPLPLAAFPAFQESRRTVHRDGHIEVAGSYYSVPPEYVGRRVWVRWDSRLVRAFNARWEQLAVHTRADPGCFRTASQHLPAGKVSAVERGAAALLKQLALIGPSVRDWSEAMLQARGVPGIRVLVGLKALAALHESQALDKACGTALSSGAWRLRTIRELLKRQGQRQQQFEFLEEHPVIRPLSDYSLDSLAAFRKERSHECDAD